MMIGTGTRVMAGEGEATRAPPAGVTAVFPDGWRGVWHVTGAPADQPDLDDAAFLRTLTAHLQGAAPPRPVFLAGISNGAGFAEHVARHGLLPLAGRPAVSAGPYHRSCAPAPRREQNPARHGHSGKISRDPSGVPEKK
jgi:poly(3-hydroxybutyrate) depolymerase